MWHLPGPLRSACHDIVPAQLLPQVLPQVGQPGQEAVPHLPSGLTQGDDEQPQNQHDAHRSHPAGAKGATTQHTSLPTRPCNRSLTKGHAVQPKSQRTGPAAVRAPIAEDRPDDAFMTENAKRKGLSNAASGRMRVTCPPHHFGPIGAEFDPERNQGCLLYTSPSPRD